MTTLFHLPLPVAPISGQACVFPVGRIFCVGRNYAAHAREMGKDPAREAPFFFMKPACALVPVPDAGTTIAYPSKTADFQHEIELVAAIGSRASRVPKDRALEHVYGYAVGLDMTRRDLQTAARDAGRPWEFGKSFACSAPLGPIQPSEHVGHPASGAIWLEVNGATRQRADLADLIWSVAEAISFLSGYDALEAGDLLYTGTPAGVGPVRPGDRMRGGITGLGEITVQISGENRL